MTAVVKNLADPPVERYQRLYSEMRDTLPGGDQKRVLDWRDRAFSAFRRTGLPTRRVETWKYTDLRSLQQAQFSAAAPTDVPASAITPYRVEGAYGVVFVDGRFAPELSQLDSLPDGLRLSSLSDTLAAGDQTDGAELGTVADADQPGFAALNGALMQDGAICRVAGGVTIDSPVQLIFVMTAGCTAESHIRNLVVLDENSHATLIQSFVSLGTSSGFCNSVTEVSVEQGGRLRHIIHQDQDRASWHIGLTAARLGRDATFNSFLLSSGARLSRNEIRILLEGEGADCRLNGIALVRDRQHCDNTTDIDHAKGHCHSSQLFKNVLDDRGRSVFQGRIHVAPDSQKTDAHQMNRNLLLSRNAQADSKPELIIHADDVKCSHGATVGDLDQDALFYLQSRGIDAAAARNLMVRAFASEMIDELPDDAVRHYLDTGINSWLDGMATEEAA